MERHSQAVDPLASSKETREKLSVQLPWKGRNVALWAWHGPVIGVHGPGPAAGTSFIKPGITAQDRDPLQGSSSLRTQTR